MHLENVLEIIFTAVATGVISTMGTVVALRVHIFYIRETLNRHEAAITRAHVRIDQHERDTWGKGEPG